MAIFNFWFNLLVDTMKWWQFDYHCYCFTDLDSLVIALRRRSDLWRSLASALRVPKEQVEVIGSHCQSDFDSLVEVCDTWLNRLKDENTPPTWQVIVSALDEAGATELSEELKKDGDDSTESKKAKCTIATIQGGINVAFDTHFLSCHCNETQDTGSIHKLRFNSVASQQCNNCTLEGYYPHSIFTTKNWRGQKCA